MGFTMSTFRRWGPPSRSRFGTGSYHLLGMFVPKPIVWLIGATLLVTAVGALLQRNGVPMLTYAVLLPEWTVRGELWRLVSWCLVELDPLNLVFGCYFLFVLGPVLLQTWGTRRFFAIYFGTAALSAGVTCLVGYTLWSEVFRIKYSGMWPVLDALVIAWAVLQPDAQMRMFFVLPMAGRHLVTFTIALTVVLAFISGFPYYIPHFAAQAFALLYMDVFSVRRLYLKGRMAMLQRDYRRRTAHLRMVERDEDKPPRWMH
jgi:membrane associated rhomboid family serine protease